MDIAACPRCASRSMHVPTIGDGGVLGISTTSQVVCDVCGFQGAPLLFEDPVDYEDFRAAVERGENPLDAEYDEYEEDLEDLEAPQAGEGDAATNLGPTKARQAQEAFDAMEDTPRPGNRVAAVFAAAIGIAIMTFTALLVGQALAADGVGSLVRGAILVVLLQVGIGIAFLAIARRLWNGSPTSQESPSP